MKARTGCQAMFGGLDCDRQKAVCFPLVGFFMPCRKSWLSDRRGKHLEKAEQAPNWWYTSRHD